MTTPFSVTQATTVVRERTAVMISSLSASDLFILTLSSPCGSYERLKLFPDSTGSFTMPQRFSAAARVSFSDQSSLASACGVPWAWLPPVNVNLA